MTGFPAALAPPERAQKQGQPRWHPSGAHDCNTWRATCFNVGRCSLAGASDPKLAQGFCNTMERPITYEDYCRGLS
eukprot:CAMPEP_0183389500 /NCGR_PEP_ID=MMETSP0370-20130417/4968_1 /TAXON_ID=268820 /ORGANISM="Peridinium aciculiferum, Strain PAER-2" /LENGTH=75 /DNA_ID=CAMNT_0025568769 /DNA_START=47 /DNA_END=274 /DNA_ORIENTATION=+